MGDNMRWACRSLLMTVYLNIPGGGVCSTEIPTMMFSSSERQAIQQTRLAGESGVQKQQMVRHAGIVQRQNGKNVVWLNNQVRKQGDPMYPQTKGTSVVLDGQELRVGDQWDTVSGARKALVPHDAIQKSR